MKASTIFTFILSLILFGGVSYVVVFVKDNISEKMSLVQNAILKQKQSENVEFGNKIKKNLEGLSSKEQVIKSAFLQSNNMVDFITKLESTGQNLGVEVVVQKVTYGDMKVLEEKYTIRPAVFEIEVRGRFDQIESFVRNVSSFEQTLYIKELRLSSSTTSNTQPYIARIIIEGNTIAYE